MLRLLLALFTKPAVISRWFLRKGSTFIAWLVSLEVMSILFGWISSVIAFVLGTLTWIFPGIAGTFVSIINTAIDRVYPEAVTLSGKTIKSITGVQVDEALLARMASEAPNRDNTRDMGTQFLQLVTEMFSVDDAAADFQGRTVNTGSIDNLRVYFGTNLTFQLRSLTIAAIATISGWGSIRHLESLHQAINWAFGFGWLSWTVMSSYMEVTVLPGLQRSLLKAVKPNDLSESEVYNAFLEGRIPEQSFTEVLDNLGQRDDIRTLLLDMRESRLTMTEVRELYQRGEIDETRVLRELQLAGYRDPRRGEKSSVIFRDRQWAIEDRIAASMGRQFRDCAIDEGTLRLRLSTIGYTAIEEDLEVGYWLGERHQRRFLTLRQMADAVEQGLITPSERLADLACMGYTTRDINVLVSLTEGGDDNRPRIQAFSISPGRIDAGDQIEVTWRVDFRGIPGTVTISPILGDVAAIGSVITSVDVNTTFRIEATNDAGTTERADSVIVNPAGDVRPPQVSFSVSPARFELGLVPTFVEVRWSTNRADSVVITPSIGPTGTEGSVVVPILLTTLFTLEATGPGGTTRRERTVVGTIPTDIGDDAGTGAFPATFSVSRGTLPRGESLELRWQADQAEEVNIQPLIGDVATVGSLIVTPEVTTTYIFTATRGEDSVTRQRSVIVTEPKDDGLPTPPPQPSISLTVRPASVDAGQDFEIRWESSNADTVNIIPDIGTREPFGSAVLQIQDTTTFRATATGPGGTASTERSVIVLPAAEPDIVREPAIQFSLRPGTIREGDFQQPVEIEWFVRRADRVSILPGLGEVGTQGSRIIFPTETTTYRLTAVGEGGTVQDDNTVIVLPPLPEPDPDTIPAPTLSFSVRSGTIDAGDTVEVRWNSRHADSVVITPQPGTVEPVGSFLLSLPASTTFRATATGPGGSVSRAVSVIVRPPADVDDPDEPPRPTGSLSVSPSRLSNAGPIEIRWVTNNATEVNITPRIGRVDESGAVVVEISQTTIFRLVATGPGGQLIREDAVIVLPPPPPPPPRDPPQPVGSFSVRPGTIDSGDIIEVNWNIRNADTVMIRPLIGQVPASGARVVPVLRTTIFQLTARGPGGVLIREEAVIVRPGTIDG